MGAAGSKGEPTRPNAGAVLSTVETTESIEGEEQEEEVHVDWGPVAVVMTAAGTNIDIAVYSLEWCLYALYFGLAYGWSGAWCGFAQMVGDLLGAGVLALSTMACLRRIASQCRCDGGASCCKCIAPCGWSSGLRPAHRLSWPACCSATAR